MYLYMCTCIYNVMLNMYKHAQYIFHMYMYLYACIYMYMYTVCVCICIYCCTSHRPSLITCTAVENRSLMGKEISVCVYCTISLVSFPFLDFSLKRTMDIVVGGKVVCVCGYGEVSGVKYHASCPLGREGGGEGGREGGREGKKCVHVYMYVCT